MSVSVVAVLKVKKEEATSVFENAIKPLVAATRKEEGVIKYEVSADSKTPNHFVFIEVYKSADAFKSHSATDHFKEAIQKIAPHFISPPEIRVLKPLL